MPRLTRRDTLRAGAAMAAGLGLDGLTGVGQTEPPRSGYDLGRLDCDVCVVGGGSGGLGAALGAARRGAKTVLLERAEMLGGTSTLAWVHSWEPSVGGGGLPREIFERM